MNKKVFPSILLLLMLLTSLVVLSGGCGGNGALDNSGNNNNNSAGVNSMMNGAWTSSNSGTAHITKLNADDNELPEEVLEQLKTFSQDAYALYQQSNSPKSVSANISSAVVFFEDCNISEDTGSMKLTAAIMVNYEDYTLPVLLSGVNLTTIRSGSTWTVSLPHYDGSLTLQAASDGNMTLSGAITYIDHEWEFSTVISKYTDEELLEDPNEILEGTWEFDNDQTGAYISNTGMLSNIKPEDVDVSIAFGLENGSVTKMAASYYLTLNSARDALDNDSTDSSSEFMSITANSGTLTQVAGNLYKFTDEDGKGILIFIESSSRIYIFTSDSDSDSSSEGESYMYLPMTKSSGFNLESAMKKSWSATAGNGGGYVHFTNLDTETDPLKKALENLSFTLKNCSLSFSGVNINDDDTVTATVNFSSVFTLTSEFFAQFMPQNERDMDAIGFDSEKLTLDITGNILNLSIKENNDEDNLYISFISDSEALLTIESKSNTGDEYDGTAKFVTVLSAN